MTNISIDYKVRAEAICEIMGKGALLQLSMPEAPRNSDVHHNWRQESMFYWLTGFAEPSTAILVLANNPVGERVHLFLRDKDPAAELWSGRRLGLKEAEKSLPIDKAHNIEDLWNELPKLLGKSDKVFFDFDGHSDWDQKFVKALAAHKRLQMKSYSSLRLPVHDASWLAGQVRLRKSPEEIVLMRKAAEITAKAFAAVFEAVRPGMNERQVHALLIENFMKNGSEMEAYPSIVAGGDNACILHYVDNNQELQDGELLLIDAGSQYEYYASDVTRTFPIGRQFTPPQRALYDLVLAAELVGISKVRKGNSMKDIHNATVEVIVDGLIDLGILSGDKKEIIKEGKFKKFFPHGTGHWLGMDVHDVGDYFSNGLATSLQPGMVCTVEPGIYIPSDCEDVAEEFRGIGIRIEDDVLVTDGEPDVLTAAIPKQAADFEERY